MTLIEKLDKAFSEYIRRSYASESGLTNCYTCSGQEHWKMLDCGHYKGRANMATRWNKDNARPQCQGCNRYGDETTTRKFRRKLIKEIGKERVEEVERLAKTEKKWMKYELEELLEYYKNES